MKHLTDEQLTAYLDGAFRGRDAEEAGRHLATCQPCSEALAELAAQDESLKPALLHDPGEAYFERFAARVEQRIGAPGTSRARPRGAIDPGRWFGPRALAWAGGVAVVVVGGGLALMTSRDGVLPGMRNRDLATRLERSAPSQAKQAPSRETRNAPPPVQRPSMDDAGQAAPPAEDAAPMAERSRAFAPAPGDAKARADAPADARMARPSRAFEVRRNEAGEEVPVRGEAGRRVDPAPSVVPPSGADQATQVRKKLVAEPLDAVKKSAPTEMLGATSPLAESGAREYSFAPPPPATPTLGATRQAAPARVAGRDVRWCGSVRDAADRPIAGAQVVLTDIGRTVTTDPTGRFCVSTPPGEHPLSVMAVGYRESRQTVRADGEADVRVTLAAVSVLDEKGMSVAGRGTPGTSRGAPSTAALDQPPAETPVEAKDGYSALPDTLRRLAREAQRIEADAAARRSAARYDLAAGAWERALRRLASGPLEIETRRHLAESRYHAWAIGPNARRARAAVEALTAYLTRAPAGPDRERAAGWLDRVRP